MIDRHITPFYNALPKLAEAGIQPAEVERFFKAPATCPKAVKDILCNEMALAIDVSISNIPSNWTTISDTWFTMIGKASKGVFKTIGQYGHWDPTSNSLRAFLLVDLSGAFISVNPTEASGTVYSAENRAVDTVRRVFSCAFCVNQSFCKVGLLQGASQFWTLTVIARLRMRHNNDISPLCSDSQGDIIPIPAFQLLMLWLGPFTSTNVERLRVIDQNYLAEKVRGHATYTKVMMSWHTAREKYTALTRVQADHCFNSFVLNFTTMPEAEACMCSVWTCKVVIPYMGSQDDGERHNYIAKSVSATKFFWFFKFFHLVPVCDGFVLFMMLQQPWSEADMRKIIANPFHESMNHYSVDRRPYMDDFMPVSPDLYTNFQTQFFVNGLSPPRHACNMEIFADGYMALVFSSARRNEVRLKSHLEKEKDWPISATSTLFAPLRAIPDKKTCRNFSMIFVAPDIALPASIVNGTLLGRLERVRLKQADKGKAGPLRTNSNRVFYNLSELGSRYGAREVVDDGTKGMAQSRDTAGSASCRTPAESKVSAETQPFHAKRQGGARANHKLCLDQWNEDPDSSRSSCASPMGTAERVQLPSLVQGLIKQNPVRLCPIDMAAGENTAGLPVYRQTKNFIDNSMDARNLLGLPATLSSARDGERVLLPRTDRKIMFLLEEALKKAGVDKNTREVTPDRTSIPHDNKMAGLLDAVTAEISRSAMEGLCLAEGGALCLGATNRISVEALLDEPPSYQPVLHAVPVDGPLQGKMVVHAELENISNANVTGMEVDTLLNAAATAKKQPTKTVDQPAQIVVTSPKEQPSVDLLAANRTKEPSRGSWFGVPRESTVKSSCFEAVTIPAAPVVSKTQVSLTGSRPTVTDNARPAVVLLSSSVQSKKPISQDQIMEEGATEEAGENRHAGRAKPHKRPHGVMEAECVALGSSQSDDIHLMKVLDDITGLCTTADGKKVQKVVKEELIQHANSEFFRMCVQRAVSTNAMNKRAKPFDIHMDEAFNSLITGQELQRLQKLKMGALAGADLLRLTYKSLHDISRIDIARRARGEKRETANAVWISERVALIASAAHELSKEIEALEKTVWGRHGSEKRQDGC